MRASLTFNIDDPDDAMSHFRCVKALDMALALYDIQEYLRDKREHPDPIWHDISKDISELLVDRGIVMEELVR